MTKVSVLIHFSRKVHVGHFKRKKFFCPCVSDTFKKTFDFFFSKAQPKNLHDRFLLFEQIKELLCLSFVLFNLKVFKMFDHSKPQQKKKKLQEKAGNFRRKINRSCCFLSDLLSKQQRQLFFF